MAKPIIVAVNRNRIASNRKHGTDDPVLRVCEGKYGKPRYANEVEAVGRVRIVYRPNAPLPCGARAWVEIERM